MKRYNPKEIEPKWQQKWVDDKLYEASEESSKPKKYILEYFPYPSGAAMHVGHVRNYTIGDALTRHARMRGYNVLHPMGWDAFGLPAENYAIKTGISPKEAIRQNTGRFKQQLTQMGFGYDWSREFASSDPEYYKWTQWFFLLLHKRGLAYRKESLQWWCPFDKTVLANEQVENGRCWRCGNHVEKKALPQWFFKITDYADRLVDDLEDLNWSDSIKTMQRNWIGRSNGAEVDFPVKTTDNYVVLHGYSGSPQTDFHPWLKNQLEKSGAQVFIPDLPNSDRPDAKEQAGFVLEHASLDENTVLVAHSYGAVTALRILEKLDRPIKKLVLIAGFAEPGFSDRERNFEATTDWSFDFEAVKQNARTVVLLRATNDSAVPRERADFLQEKLGGTIVDFTAEENHVCGKIEPVVLQHVANNIRIFTTRPDTLYGATFMVLAPEHPLVSEITTDEHRQTVQNYIAATQAKSDIERQETDREKTGVFTGAYAVNPVNNEHIPVWVADYVLYGYGTGAIMAVPGHDERDHEFALKFQLPIRQVIAERFIHTANPHRSEAELVPRQVATVVLQHPTEQKYLIVKPTGSEYWSPLMGGIDDGESAEIAARREIEEETGYYDFQEVKVSDEILCSEFYAQHKQQNRIAYCQTVFVQLASLDRRPVSDQEATLQQTKWVTTQEAKQLSTGAGAAEIYQLAEGTKRGMVYEGRLINSEAYDGILTEEARERIVADLTSHGAGRERTNYKIRDWLISRQRYWGVPIPMIHCSKCGTVPVPEDQLPVTLPDLKSFEPSGDGRSPLARVPEFVNTTCPQCDGPAERETDTMDGFACSSWYFLRFADPRNNEKPFDPAKIKHWLPVDDYIGGAEHAVMHLLYARMWTKVMQDEGLIDFGEPFKTLRNQGMILAPDGQKMSKSKGNTIEPDGLIEQGYGADAIRIMELFIGPWNQSASWSVEGMGGAFRFLQRAWTLTQELIGAGVLSIPDEGWQTAGQHPPQAHHDESGDGAKGLTGPQPQASEELKRAMHRASHRVSRDLEDMGFNTAIAALMETLNELYKLKTTLPISENQAAWHEAIGTFLQLLAPFAPHITEELWHQLGREGSVHQSEWPAWDDKYLVSDHMTIVVQVNGKLRAELQVATDATKELILEQAQADPKASPYLQDKEIKKRIYVPGKLVNFVV